MHTEVFFFFLTETFIWFIVVQCRRDVFKGQKTKRWRKSKGHSFQYWKTIETSKQVHLHTAYNCFLSPTMFIKKRNISLTLTLKHEQSSGDWLLKPRLQIWKKQIFQDWNFPHLDYTLLCMSAKRVGLRGAGAQSHTQLQCFHLSQSGVNLQSWWSSFCQLKEAGRKPEPAAWRL